MQAEMDNIQRRVKEDISKAHKFALEKFILELLPTIDGLERAVMTHANEAAEVGGLLDGVNLTLKMLYSSLEKFAVSQVDPLGQVFNPELHQAISTQADPTAKSNTVLNVLQKGYLLNNRLLRPALVIVAK
jgi:molecular chaperone GrpE